MSARLHVSNTDQFNDVGEGGRQNGELWYRADLNEIRAFLSGQIRTLFNSSGQPGTPSPTIYSAVSDAGFANGDTWYRSDLKEIRTMIDDKVFTLADVNGPAGGGAVFTVNYVPTETVYVYVVNPISFVS